MGLSPGFDRPPASSERRHLTIMFSDVVGSTRLSDGADVEATFVMLNAYYDACREVVERHGGVIALHQGDGIFAWFGHPLPRDDDAIRAVRAGRDLLATLRDLSARLEPEIGEPIAARVGVHAGEALMAPVEQTGRLSAYGYTTNLAAKLQQYARPGTVVVSEAVLRLVRDDFEVVPRSPIEVGDGAATLVYEVVSERRQEGRLARSWRTGLVGRDAERARLRELWAAVRDGDGGVVALVGARGIGKTRLAAETLSTAGSDQARVLDCLCVHLHTNTPYRPFRTLLEQAAGIEPSHSPALAASLLQDHLIGGLGMRPESMSLLGRVAGLRKEIAGPLPDLDPSRLAQLTTELLVEWVTRLAATPTAIVIDDVTDADPSSLTVLERLVGALPPRLLLVFTVRSDVPAPAFLGAGAVRTVELQPLAADACEALVDAVSGGTLEERARRHVLEQGDGIPLFLEELARVAQDGAGAGLPITLTGHLQARLLAPQVDREIRGALAVAGGDLDESILAAVIGAEPTALLEQIAPLLASDLVVRVGGSGYRFRHGLISEAAYELLLRGQRVRLHGKLADTLVERRPAGGQVDWDVVGRHLKLARRPLDAFEAMMAGADKASQAGSYPEALRGYQSALEVLAEVSDADTRERLEIRCRAAKGGTAVASRGFGSDEAFAEFDRCGELCRRLGASPLHLSAIFGIQSFHITRGEPEAGRQLCFEVQSWVDAGHEWCRPDHALLTTFVEFYEGNYRAAGEWADVAVQEYTGQAREPGAGSSWLLPYDPVVLALIHQGTVKWIVGRADEGRTAYERAAARAEQIGFPAGPFSLAYVRSHQGWTAAVTGDHAAGARLAREVREIGQRHGFAFWENCGAIHLSISEYQLSGRPDAVETAERHAVIWGKIGGRPFLPYVYAAVADIRATMGQHELAAAWFDTAADLAARNGMGFYESERLRLRALAFHGSEEETQVQLRQAWEIASCRGAWLFELRAALELARRSNDPEWASQLSELVTGRESLPEYPEIDQARTLLAGAR